MTQECHKCSDPACAAARAAVPALVREVRQLQAEIGRLRAILSRIASDEPYIRLDRISEAVTEEQLNAANRAQIQQAIAWAALEDKP